MKYFKPFLFNFVYNGLYGYDEKFIYFEIFNSKILMKIVNSLKHFSLDVTNLDCVKCFLYYITDFKYSDF